jgi:hypothetical protein
MVKNLKSLDEFKDFTQRTHSSYSLANHGLEILAEKIQLADGFNDNENYKVLDGESGQVISAIPNFHIIKGLKRDGPISQVIAHGMLSMIYHAWENRFRPMIAKELGVSNNEVMSDLMSDIKILRHKIAHNLGFLDKDLKKLKIINWLEQGHIILKTNDMNKIQLKINNMDVYVSNSHSGRT